MRFGVKGVAMTWEWACGIAAPDRAPVLQHQHVAEARVAPQVAQPVAIRLSRRIICGGGKIGPGLVVLGRVGHQLVGADRVHHVEHAGAAAGELPLDAQQRMLVGGDTHAPGAAVLDAGDLDRVQVLVSGTERAGARRLGAAGRPGAATGHRCARGR